MEELDVEELEEKEPELQDIGSIAAMLSLSEHDIERYGNRMAKIPLSIFQRLDGNRLGHLILVTSMTPTTSGEGKTTISIGLADALSMLGEKVVVNLREPSLGPCFGIKGGATGGGRAAVKPMDRINLIFTADFPSIAAAHNLLSSLINNHIFHGNELNLDPKRIVFPRTVDMNDRSLRSIIVGVGERDKGVMAMDSFVITPASEVMAIVALASDYTDLKERLSRILIGFTFNGDPVYAGDLKAQGSMAALLKYAMQPNLVQTGEGTPALIHTGPFGNIAHGTSSLIADRLGLMLTDYVVTEAGFGSDLGGEKFVNLVSRVGKLKIDAVVIVATVKAIKRQGGDREGTKDNMKALEAGMANLLKHVHIMQSFGFDPVVAVNRFSSDTTRELNYLMKKLSSTGIISAVVDAFENGGEGALELAKLVIKKAASPPPALHYTYEMDDDVKLKIEKVAREVYGARDVVFEHEAVADLATIEKMSLSHLPISMAKTQYSLSDDKSLLNAPADFDIHVERVLISSGAGFLVPLLGEIMTMPGLPKSPAADRIDITPQGEIIGLY